MPNITSAVVLIVFSASLANAQLLNKKGEEVHPYYISFDEPLPVRTENVRGEYLHISYHDQIGESETITLEVHQLKEGTVRTLSLVKQFGQNYFDINLDEKGVSLEEGGVYACRLRDEKGHVRERSIRYVSKLKHDMTASIVVSPKYLSCQDELGNNLIEFFGQVSGGKAPYKTNWYVLNAQRTGFLYQPTQVIVPSAGLTSSVQVDKDPEYYVLLLVTDACGNEQTASVQIVCEKNEKRVNTLFFQKLDDAMVHKLEIPNK